MKKLFALTTLLLLLCGCAVSPRQVDGTLTFYYRTQADSKASLTQVAASELRNPPSEDASMEDIIRLYLEGPKSDTLTSPFPAGTDCYSARVKSGLLTLVLTEEYAQLEGVERSIADYCLTQTLTALENVDSVLISSYGSGAEKIALSSEDFVLADDFESYSDERITVYFADEDDRYLLAEGRRMVAGENETVERYVVQQLINGPMEQGKLPVIPAGTELLSISIDDGICTVNFSEEFLSNRPKTEAEERMTVYALVNSLTELNGIDAVKIRAVGQDIELYRYMFLSEPIPRNEEAIKLSKIDGYIDATFYLKNWSPDFLASVPVLVPKLVSRTEEYTAAKALFEYEPPSGYQNPIPKGTVLLSTETENGICKVDVSKEFISGCAPTAAAERLAIMSIVLCLTDFEHIDKVQITVEGLSRDHLYYPMSEPISRSDELFFP